MYYLKLIFKDSEEKERSTKDDLIFRTWIRGYLESRAEIKGGKSTDVTEESVTKVLNHTLKWRIVRIIITQTMYHHDLFYSKIRTSSI